MFYFLWVPRDAETFIQHWEDIIPLQCTVLIFSQIIQGLLFNMPDLQSFIFQYVYCVDWDQSWKLLTWWNLLENSEKGFTILWLSVLSCKTLRHRFSLAENLNHLFWETSWVRTLFQGTLLISLHGNSLCDLSHVAISATRSLYILLWDDHSSISSQQGPAVCHLLLPRSSRDKMVCATMCLFLLWCASLCPFMLPCAPLCPHGPLCAAMCFYHSSTPSLLFLHLANIKFGKEKRTHYVFTLWFK